MPLLLITSSRTWQDAITAEYWLGQAWHALGSDPETALLSGNAEGGDRVCEKIWDDHGMPIRRMKADWLGPCRERCTYGHRKTNRGGLSYCPAAGMYRNEDMVMQQPGLVLELRDLCVKENCWKTPKPHWSHGAEACANFAESVGLPVWRVPA